MSLMENGTFLDLGRCHCLTGDVIFSSEVFYLKNTELLLVVAYF